MAGWSGNVARREGEWVRVSVSVGVGVSESGVNASRVFQRRSV